MSEEQRLFCNRCKNHTRHILRGQYDQEFHLTEYPDMEIDYAKGTWQIWQCLGCDEVVFFEEWFTLEDEDPISGEITPTQRLYPERENNKPTHIIERKEFDHIPDNLSNLYNEIINTFNQGTGILCAVGLRALIEGICVDKNITKGLDKNGVIKNNLEGKINSMKSIVPKNIADNLHGFRFMGNEAVHQLAMPSVRDLALAITIVEDILNIVYDLNYKTSRLFQRMNKSNPTSQPPPTNNTS